MDVFRRGVQGGLMAGSLGCLVEKTCKLNQSQPAQRRWAVMEKGDKLRTVRPQPPCLLPQKVSKPRRWKYRVIKPRAYVTW